MTDRLDRIERLVKSNVKSIRVLTDDMAKMKRDRDGEHVSFVRTFELYR